MPLPKNTTPDHFIKKDLRSFLCTCRMNEMSFIDDYIQCPVHTQGLPPVPQCRDCVKPSQYEVLLNSGKVIAVCYGCYAKRRPGKATKWFDEEDERPANG